MTKQSEPRERRTPASKRSSNGRKLLNWQPPEVANSYWLKLPNRFLIGSRSIIYFKYSKLLQIHSASIFKDQLADLQSRGFPAAKLSSLKTSEFKECRVEIILCSAEEALTKEFTSELKSSSSKLHQPSLWINCILCKHGQGRGYWLVNFKSFYFQSKSEFEYIDQCAQPRHWFYEHRFCKPYQTFLALSPTSGLHRSLILITYPTHSRLPELRKKEVFSRTFWYSHDGKTSLTNAAVIIRFFGGISTPALLC